MNEYIPSPRQWVADQVDLYERSGGTEGLNLRNTDLPVVIVTNRGWKTGAIRKTPVMRVADGQSYILVASNGGAPDNPLWVNNLRTHPDVTVQDETEVYTMRVREVTTAEERARLWPIALTAFPRYQKYQDATVRVIPMFVAEPVEASVTKGEN